MLNTRFAVGEIFYDHAGNECYYRDNGTLCVRTVNNEPSLTVQSERDECDINNIVERYVRTGVMTNVSKLQPLYGDFSDVVDFHTAVIRLQEAEEAFMTLPADVRKRFSNDPGELMDFLSNPDNRAEAIKLGLVAAPQDLQNPQGDDIPTPPKDGAKASSEGG